MIPINLVHTPESLLEFQPHLAMPSRMRPLTAFTSPGRWAYSRGQFPTRSF